MSPYASYLLIYVGVLLEILVCRVAPILLRDPKAGVLPFVAALPVIFVAKKTGSLIWSAVVGMLAYAALFWVV